MQTTETTLKQPPIPRNFILKLTDQETAGLLEAVQSILAPGIGDALAGRTFSFANIRVVNAANQAQTCEVQLQLIEAAAAPAVHAVKTPAAAVPAAPSKPAA